MKKMNLKKKISLVASLLVILLAVFSLTVPPVHAMTIQIAIAPQATVYNTSDKIVFNYQIVTTAASGEGSQLQATVHVANGTITGMTCNVGTCAKTDAYTWTLLYTADKNNKTYGGTVTIQPAGSGTVTLSFTSVKATDLKNTGDSAVASKTATTYVRTAAEEATWRAEQKAIQESIARKQAEDASRQAAEEAKRNASIAESASVEESIKESIYEESSRQASIEESIAESESLEELTRPTEIGHETFILLQWGKEDEEGQKEHKFWFASKGSNVPIPVEFEEVDLQIREMDVLAFKQDGMDRNTYLVYGTPKMSEEPMWMYFHNDEDDYSFFDYKYLNSNAKFIDPDESESESDTETDTDSEEGSSSEVASSEAASKERKGFEVKGDYLIFLILAIIVGALLMTFIFLMIWPRKEKEEEDSMNPEDNSAWIPQDPKTLKERNQKTSEISTPKDSFTESAEKTTEKISEKTVEKVSEKAAVIDLSLKEINDATNEEEVVPNITDDDTLSMSLNDKLEQMREERKVMESVIMDVPEKDIPSEDAEFVREISIEEHAASQKAEQIVEAAFDDLEPNESTADKTVQVKRPVDTKKPEMNALDKKQPVKRRLFETSDDAFKVDDSFFEFDDIETGAKGQSSEIEADAVEIEESLKSIQEVD